MFTLSRSYSCFVRQDLVFFCDVLVVMPTTNEKDFVAKDFGKISRKIFVFGGRAILR